MDNALYKTADINLAAVLKLKGFHLDSIDVVGTKGTFNFVDVPENEILDFDLGNQRVEPVSFNNQIKSLTTSVRRMKDYGGVKDVK